jgi:hypothetical protein
MTSRTTLAASLTRAANPIDDNAYETAWSDAEGRAALDRILADDRPAPAVKPHRMRGRFMLGAAVAAAAGAAVAIVGIPGANHNGTPAAWAVTKNADGTVTVKISDYTDPEGLQGKLRQAGLRADVVTLPPSCVPRTRGSVFVGVEGDTFTPPYDVASFITVNGVPLFGSAPYSGTEPLQALEFRPSELPPQDTVTIGFPADKTGGAMGILLAHTGATLQPCSLYDSNGAPVPTR